MDTGKAVIDIEFSEELKKQYSNASIGILLLNNITNNDPGDRLGKVKSEVEASLISRYSDMERDEISKNPVLSAYREYYRKFKKTYHLLLQLESVARKGRGFPSVNPLVDSCFVAEMKTLVLTAGHDADLLSGTVVFDISTSRDEFPQINGRSIVLKADDMIMKSGGRNVCSVIYGQDNSTVLSRETVNALYVSYAPEGVDESIVSENLDFIEYCVSLFSPLSETLQKNVYRF